MIIMLSFSHKFLDLDKIWYAAMTSWPVEVRANIFSAGLILRGDNFDDFLKHMFKISLRWSAKKSFKCGEYQYFEC